jgi:hypothetical protein
MRDAALERQKENREPMAALGATKGSRNGLDVWKSTRITGVASNVHLPWTR